MNKQMECKPDGLVEKVREAAEVDLCGVIPAESFFIGIIMILAILWVFSRK